MMDDSKIPELRRALIEQQTAQLQTEMLTIVGKYAARLHRAKRREAKLRFIWLLVSLFFGLLAGYSFADPVGFIPGAWPMYACMSLCFLAIPVISVIVNRLAGDYPTHEKDSNTHARTQV